MDTLKHIHNLQQKKEYKEASLRITEFQKLQDFWQLYYRFLVREFPDNSSTQYFHFREAVFTVVQNSNKTLDGHDTPPTGLSLLDYLTHINDSVGKGHPQHITYADYFDKAHQHPRRGTVSRYTTYCGKDTYLDTRRWRITQNPRTVHFLGVRRKWLEISQKN